MRKYRNIKHINNMEKETPHFEATPQIIRYMDAMLDTEDKFFAQLTGDVILVETYLPGENINLKTESNIKSFWIYLARTKAIEYLTNWSGKSGIDDWIFIKPGIIEGQRATLGYPKKQRVRILDIHKIKELYEEIIRTKKGNENSSSAENKLSDKYEITLKDREIWINNKYLLSKPHSVGSNMEFFIYLLRNTNKKINRKDMPEDVKKEISNKKISKILNALGFTGEILKVFFPQRGKTKLLFKQTVSKKEIHEMGIDQDLFLKELELSHMKKYSSK
jgi:hypothetical protein